MPLQNLRYKFKVPTSHAASRKTPRWYFAGQTAVPVATLTEIDNAETLLCSLDVRPDQTLAPTSDYGGGAQLPSSMVLPPSNVSTATPGSPSI